MSAMRWIAACLLMAPLVALVGPASASVVHLPDLNVTGDGSGDWFGQGQMHAVLHSGQDCANSTLVRVDPEQGTVVPVATGATDAGQTAGGQVAWDGSAYDVVTCDNKVARWTPSNGTISRGGDLPPGWVWSTLANGNRLWMVADDESPAPAFNGTSTSPCHCLRLWEYNLSEGRYVGSHNLTDYVRFLAAFGNNSALVQRSIPQIGGNDLAIDRLWLSNGTLSPWLRFNATAWSNYHSDLPVKAAADACNVYAIYDEGQMSGSAMSWWSHVEAYGIANSTFWQAGYGLPVHVAGAALVPFNGSLYLMQGDDFHSAQYHVGNQTTRINVPSCAPASVPAATPSPTTTASPGAAIYPSYPESWPGGSGDDGTPGPANTTAATNGTAETPTSASTPTPSPSTTTPSATGTEPSTPKEGDAPDDAARTRGTTGAEGNTSTQDSGCAHGCGTASASAVSASQSAPALALAASAASIAVVAAGLGIPRPRARLLAFSIVGLARLQDKPLLDNPKRWAIVDLVRTRPGIHEREIHRQTGMGRGELQRNLQVLVTAGHVWEHKDGNRRTLWPPGTTAPAPPPRSERARRVLDAVVKQPGCTIAEVARDVGASYRGAAYHLERLHAAGHADIRRDGLVLRAFPRAPGPGIQPQQAPAGLS